MYQVLFRIPVRVFDWMPTWLPDSLPIFGYAMMLLCAFLACTFLAGRLARKHNIAGIYFQDLAVWIFGFGILGARITYVIQYDVPLQNFFEIWKGGLVFYGSFLGGVVGYVLAHIFVIRKQHLSAWKMIDIIAPCVAVGLCLGRMGCFLNGCCYGNVACTDCPAVHFPLCSAARYALTANGLQTAAGFTVHVPGRNVPPVVEAVEPGSPAAASGLQPGDAIVKAEGQPIDSYSDLDNLLLENWPRGQKTLALTVERSGTAVTLPPFAPRTLGLHPTQLYESVSAFLLLLVLLAYTPLRRRDGEVMALFLVCYAVHRFLNEMLRNDTDPVAFGMTLSQNLSILFLLAGLGLFVWLRRRPEPAPPRSAKVLA